MIGNRLFQIAVKLMRNYLYIDFVANSFLHDMTSINYLVIFYTIIQLMNVTNVVLK